MPGTPVGPRIQDQYFVSTIIFVHPVQYFVRCPLEHSPQLLRVPRCSADISPIPSLVVMGFWVYLEFPPNWGIFSRNLAPNLLLVTRMGRVCVVSHGRSSFFFLPARLAGLVFVVCVLMAFEETKF